MKKFIFIIGFVFVFFLFNTCALEIANVIGPGGGWVFYDKGNYDGGWRYIECASFDFGEIKGEQIGDTENTGIKKAIDLCKDHSDGRYRFPWEIPEESVLEKMLDCFTYGLTQFKDDIYYLSVNNLYHPVPGYPSLPLEPDADKGNAVVLYMNYDNSMFGEVKETDKYDVVRVRPIRRF